jgi:hypothetical protein
MAPPSGAACVLATYGGVHRPEAEAEAAPTAGLSPAAASSLQQQLGSAAFSAAAAPMVVLDTSRAGLPVVYHNLAFAQLLQLPPGAPAALAGRPWSLLHCADTDAGAAARLESELRAGRCPAAELLCSGGAGRRFWAALSSGFLRNGAGAATPYAVLVADDLTAAKAAEAAHLLRDHALSNLREGIRWAGRAEPPLAGGSPLAAGPRPLCPAHPRRPSPCILPAAPAASPTPTCRTRPSCSSTTPS